MTHRELLSLGRSLLDSYSEILFMQRAWPGALMLLATLSVPAIGFSGLVSVAAAFVFARFIGVAQTFLESGFFTYNTLLVGLGLGSLFQLTPLSLLFAATAGVMTLIISLMLNSLFSQYLRLPILSLPFVIISAVAYLASLGYSNLLLREPVVLLAQWSPAGLPDMVRGFLQSLGAILFLPYPLTGLIFALVLLWYSRILFLLALGGFLLGATMAGVLDGAPGSAFLDPNNFNFILIATALGGVFLVPSRHSLLIAAIGVILATVLMDAVNLFWALYGIPAFTLPFNLVTLGLLYVLMLVAFPAVADRISATPEETLDDHLNRRRRFPLEPKRLQPPFSGCWTVWQGFDGPWTHQGTQAHALDFVIEQNGSTFRQQGANLDDYYSWRKPVLAPIRGRVAAVHDGVIDNLPGELNQHENWGNWVSIDSGFGWHLILAHFANGTLQVTPGDWVEPGSRLGLCGNSGYSPQPHIHLHIQVGFTPGEATLPFLLQGFMRDACEFSPAAIPQQGQCVTPLYPAEHLQLTTSLLLDSEWQIEVRRHGKLDSRSRFRVRMNAQGESCLDSGKGQLFFHRDREQFYFYRLDGNDQQLALLFRVLPRLPLAYQQGLWWHDQLPLAVHPRQGRRHLLNLARVLFPDLGRIDYSAKFTGKRRLEGVVTSNEGKQRFSVELSSRHGLIHSIQMDDLLVAISEVETPDKTQEISSGNNTPS